MINLFDLNFTIFTVTDIIGLYICAFVLKRLIKSFPNKLIPVTTVILSIFTSLIYTMHSRNTEVFPYYFFLLTGTINGMAAVGLHQIFKQTISYFSFKRQMKNINKDRRRTIS